MENPGCYHRDVVKDTMPRSVKTVRKVIACGKQMGPRKKPGMRLIKAPTIGHSRRTHKEDKSSCRIKRFGRTILGKKNKAAKTVHGFRREKGDLAWATGVLGRLTPHKAQIAHKKSKEMSSAAGGVVGKTDSRDGGAPPQTASASTKQVGAVPGKKSHSRRGSLKDESRKRKKPHPETPR